MAQDYYNQRWVGWLPKIIGLRDVIGITIWQSAYFKWAKGSVSVRTILHEYQHKKQWRIFMDAYTTNFRHNFGFSGGKIIEWLGIIEYIFRYNWKTVRLAYGFWRKGHNIIESINLGYRNNPYEIEARLAERGELL